MEKIGQNTVIFPELEKIQKSGYSTFNLGICKQPFFERSWHYHPECELLLITHGYGRRFVGDHSEDFKAGDLVLLGAYLPHAWISDKNFIDDENNDFCESIYVQFSGTLFDSLFFELPEFQGVKNVVKKSERGIKVLGEAKERVKEILLSLSGCDSFERAQKVIYAINLIDKGKAQFLASREFLSKQKFYNSSRMQKIHQFIMEKFKNEIKVEDCAKIAGMTKSSFCRFFKKQTQHTFTKYLNSIRVDFARKLILNTDMPIKQVGYECGFESISYFNQVFKSISGTSPNQYKRQKI